MTLRAHFRQTMLVIAMLGIAACGDDPVVPPDASPPMTTPREVVMSTQPLQVGEFAEGTMTGGAGDIAVIKLSAPLAEMGWNIHGHADGSTQTIYEAHDAMVVEYTFAPTKHAEWYLLVRNEGIANMEVSIRVELFGEMAWAWL